MNPKGVRHNRILELRGMALTGHSLEDLHVRCINWGVSKGTMYSYVNEVIDSIVRKMKK